MGGLNIVDNEVTTATISPTTLLGYWDKVGPGRNKYEVLIDAYMQS